MKGKVREKQDKFYKEQKQNVLELILEKYNSESVAMVVISNQGGMHEEISLNKCMKITAGGVLD